MIDILMLESSSLEAKGLMAYDEVNWNGLCLTCHTKAKL